MVEVEFSFCQQAGAPAGQMPSPMRRSDVFPAGSISSVSHPELERKKETEKGATSDRESQKGKDKLARTQPIPIPPTEQGVLI